MPTTERTTEGQALLNLAAADADWYRLIYHRVPLIEAEARAEGYAAGLAAAREAVAGLRTSDMTWTITTGGWETHTSRNLARDAVLAAIDSLSGSSSPHADADLAVDPSGHAGPADLHDPRSEEQG